MSTTAMVPVGYSRMPRWLDNRLVGYRPDVLVPYFAHRGLQVYYDEGADPSYLESGVGTLARSRAIAAWCAVEVDSTRLFCRVCAGGAVSAELARVLTEEAELSPHAVWRDVEVPGPGVVQVAIWDEDWWRPELELAVGVDFAGAPSVEEVRRASDLGRALGPGCWWLG